MTFFTVSAQAQTVEDIQKIVNSLNELYIVATNNMNSMLENMDF